MARAVTPLPAADLAARIAGYLGTSRLADQAGFWEQATANAYYACLHAARALLATAGIASETHEGTQEMLSLHVVRPGVLPSATGRTLKTLLAVRELADAGVGGDIDAQAAQEAVRDAAAILHPILAALPLRDPTTAAAAAAAAAALAALEAAVPAA